jgi:hypothetical protein
MVFLQQKNLELLVHKEQVVLQQIEVREILLKIKSKTLS